MRKASIVLVLLALSASACGGNGGSTRTSPGIVTATPSQENVASQDHIEGLFDVGGHRLFMECQGTGSPPIVLLHGVGGNSTDWSATLSGLSSLRTCIYDRLNVGRSDRDPGRHTVTDSVADLRGLMDVVGINPPYLLVAHSWGGMLGLMYAAMHPDEVAGMLLVDATLPLEAGLDPPELVDQIKAEVDDNQEHVDFYDSYAEVGAMLDPHPPIPITYMFGTLQEPPPEWVPGAYEKALHRFIESLPRGRLVEEKSGHNMPREIPEEVASQTLNLLEEIGF